MYTFLATLSALISSVSFEQNTYPASILERVDASAAQRTATAVDQCSLCCHFISTLCIFYRLRDLRDLFDLDSLHK